MKKIPIYIVLVIALTFPGVTSALSLYAETGTVPVRVGDTRIIKVYVDTIDTEINSLEGTLSVADEKVESVLVGNSVFSLWPVYPKVQGQSISFVGGTPSGVYGKYLLLFSLVVTPDKEGSINITTKDVYAYLSDGTGTKVSIPAQVISVPVLSAQKEKQNDIAVLQKEDAAGPVYLSVEVGQDTRVFDGQPFISFVARDSGSGVAYYEISEQGEKFTTEDTVYVLKHPATKGVVSITAVDHVGNKTKTEIYVGAKPYSRTIMVFVAIGLVLGIFVWRFVFRKKHEVVQ